MSITTGVKVRLSISCSTEMLDSLKARFQRSGSKDQNVHTLNGGVGSLSFQDEYETRDEHWAGKQVYLESTQHVTEENTEKVLRSSASGLASNQLSTDFQVV